MGVPHVRELYKGKLRGLGAIATELHFQGALYAREPIHELLLSDGIGDVTHVDCAGLLRCAVQRVQWRARVRCRGVRPDDLVRSGGALVRQWLAWVPLASSSSSPRVTPGWWEGCPTTRWGETLAPRWRAASPRWWVSTWRRVPHRWRGAGGPSPRRGHWGTGIGRLRRRWAGIGDWWPRCWGAGWWRARGRITAIADVSRVRVPTP
mmetsp:Transcript_6556/g.12239  ORF Transcript_6556/g.12239 Transcript_6556/m.12239 type:complete len:207 (-) Transcript_6556:204-824(-)